MRKLAAFLVERRDRRQLAAVGADAGQSCIGRKDQHVIAIPVSPLRLDRIGKDLRLALATHVNLLQLPLVEERQEARIRETRTGVSRGRGVESDGHQPRPIRDPQHQFAHRRSMP